MTHALHVLLALGTGTRHGYAIMREAREASGGRIEILPGTLYATIKSLLADGLIEEVPPPRTAHSADARRRYYRVTRAGRARALAETERLAELVRMGRVFARDAR
ncbi:MAG: PadR family transcriptional regulator [Vicinamibacterales bacterium]